MLATESYEAWLLAWPPGSVIDPHDHGNSRGAFVVFEGSLLETCWRNERRRRRTLAAFDAAAVPVGGSQGSQRRVADGPRRPRLLPAAQGDAHRTVAEPAVDRALATARGQIGERVLPAELRDEIAGGALVVDIRPAAQRTADGELPGAVVVEPNVLEWRLDPTSPHRLAAADRPDRRMMLVCGEGYASSLTAAALRSLGLTNVTDLAGGFQARHHTQTAIRD